MRIAFFTSLNPQQSGCSDHAEELLPYLGRYADVDVMISGSYTPVNAEVTERFRILHYREYLKNPSVYDIAVYQVGNHLVQTGYMIPCLRAAPGIVFLQDYSLQYLVLGLTLGLGDPGALTQALQPVYGERTPQLVRKLLLGLQDPGELTFAHPFLEAGRGLIIPSAHLLDIVHKQVPHKTARYISMGLPTADGGETRHELRQKYGYDDDEFIIASVSTLAPKKRLEVLLEALHKARNGIAKPRLLLVGAGSPGASVHQMIRELGLADIIEQTGRVEADHYQHLIRLADIAVDMRDMTAAETAHSALRCLRYGTPVISSASGTFLEIPDSCCLKLARDDDQADALAAALLDFSAHPERLEAMSKAALEYGDEYLSLDLQAREFIAFFKTVADTTAGEGRVALLEPTASRGKKLYALLYKAARGFQLVRRYGIADSLRRFRVKLAQRIKAEDSGDI